MTKAKGNALCGAIVALAAIYATTRGDVAFAAPMFLIAVVLAGRARRDWKQEA